MYAAWERLDKFTVPHLSSSANCINMKFCTIEELHKSFVKYIYKSSKLCLKDVTIIHKTFIKILSLTIIFCTLQRKTATNKKVRLSALHAFEISNK